MLRVVEAVGEGAEGNTKVSGLLSADDLVGMSGTPEGLQKQISAAAKVCSKVEALRKYTKVFHDDTH